MSQMAFCASATFEAGGRASDVWVRPDPCATGSVTWVRAVGVDLVGSGAGWGRW